MASERAGVLEVLIGLAGEAHDDVGGQRDGGDARPQEVGQLAELVGVVGARHLAQHPGRAGLQGQMKMAADAALGLGEERDELAGHVHRLDGADAEAAGRLARAVQIGGGR